MGDRDPLDYCIFGVQQTIQKKTRVDSALLMAKRSLSDIYELYSTPVRYQKQEKKQNRQTEKQTCTKETHIQCRARSNSEKSFTAVMLRS